MKPPNWFLTIAAFCLVMLTILAFAVAARTAHDWQREGFDIFDRKTGVWCATTNVGKTACLDLTTGKKVH